MPFPTRIVNAREKSQFSAVEPRPGKGNLTTDNVDLGRHLVIRIVHCTAWGFFPRTPTRASEAYFPQVSKIVVRSRGCEVIFAFRQASPDPGAVDQWTEYPRVNRSKQVTSTFGSGNYPGTDRRNGKPRPWIMAMAPSSGACLLEPNLDIRKKPRRRVPTWVSSSHVQEKGAG